MVETDKGRKLLRVLFDDFIWFLVYNICQFIIVYIFIFHEIVMGVVIFDKQTGVIPVLLIPMNAIWMSKKKDK